MGIIDSVKNARDNKRYGGLGKPEPGIQAFPYRDWKSHHVKRYCEIAEESGFVVDLASHEEARDRERLLEDAGVGIGRSWHVLVWRPGEPRPALTSQLVSARPPDQGAS